MSTRLIATHVLPRPSRTFLLVLLSWIVLGIGGCFLRSPTEPDSLPAEITLIPADTVLVSLGEVVRFEALVRDPTGALLTDIALDWTSDADSILRHESAGAFRAISPGSTAISARVTHPRLATEDPLIGRAHVDVEQHIDRLVLLSSRPKLWAVGQAARLSLHAYDRLGTAVPITSPITWQSSDGKIATVDDEGVVTASASGSVQLEARTEGLSASIDIGISTTVRYQACFSAANELDAPGELCASATLSIHDAAGFPLLATP